MKLSQRFWEFLLAGLMGMALLVVVHMFYEMNRSDTPIIPLTHTMPQQHMVDIKVSTDTGEISVTDVGKKVMEDDEIMKSTTIENPEPEFSGMTKVMNGVGHMKIYGTISGAESTYLFSDYIILKNKYNIKKLVVTVDSGGGSAFAGMAIANLIRLMESEGVEIEGYAIGKVASAAVPIFASCSKRYAYRDCVFMVHKASLRKIFAEETMEDLDSQKSVMSMLRNSYMRILAENSKLSEKEWLEKIMACTWFSTEQALEWGLVDEIK